MKFIYTNFDKSKKIETRLSPDVVGKCFEHNGEFFYFEKITFCQRGE